MAFWLPPGFIEEMGMDPSSFGYGSTPAYTGLRFCLKCETSQRTDPEEPCWCCGGETGTDRPPYWPNVGSGETVRGGRSFSPRELELSEEDAEHVYNPEAVPAVQQDVHSD